MSLLVHMHMQVHYNIHVFVQRDNTVRLQLEVFIKPQKAQYDHLPGTPVVNAFVPEFSTETYQFHVNYHLHVHMYGPRN